MESNEKSQLHSNPGIYIIVFAILVCLTGLTIFVSRLDLGGFATFAALVIAALKSTLVALYFMHLKYENKLFGIMFLIAILTITVIIIFTFFDIAYR
jgi:cytochrome c oxidase subunit 4